MDQQVLSRSQTRWIWLGLFHSIQPKIKQKSDKANVVANALNRSWPPREQDQESKQHKLQIANAVEVEATQAQYQDQSFFNFIKAAEISLSKAQMQQFIKA